MLKDFSNSKSLQHLLRLLKADLSLILSLLRVCMNNESQRLFLNLELRILPWQSTWTHMDTVPCKHLQPLGNPGGRVETQCLGLNRISLNACLKGEYL